MKYLTLLVIPLCILCGCSEQDVRAHDMFGGCKEIVLVEQVERKDLATATYEYVYTCDGVRILTFTEPGAVARCFPGKYRAGVK